MRDSPGDKDRRIAELTWERDRLRRRVVNQRRQLRQLNRGLGKWWSGWYYHSYVAATNEYQAKMIRSLGREAVEKAEHT